MRVPHCIIDEIYGYTPDDECELIILTYGLTPWIKKNLKIYIALSLPPRIIKQITRDLKRNACINIFVHTYVVDNIKLVKYLVKTYNINKETDNDAIMELFHYLNLHEQVHSVEKIILSLILASSFQINFKK